MGVERKKQLDAHQLTINRIQVFPNSGWQSRAYILLKIIDHNMNWYTRVCIKTL